MSASSAAESSRSAAQSGILERIAGGEELDGILETIARQLELCSRDSLCSILTRIDDGPALRAAVSPSLPAEFGRAVNELPSTLLADACAAVARRGDSLKASADATDPIWDGLGELALRHGLKAAWTTPIAAAQGEILGAIVLCYRSDRQLSGAEKAAVASWVLPTALAIKLARMERRLREHADEMETLLDTLPVAVLIAHDSDALEITGNQCAQAMLKVPAGANLSLSAPPKQRNAPYRAFRRGRRVRPEELPVQRAARGERVINEELDLLLHDGSVQHLFESAAPLLDGDGRVRGAVAVSIDITDRKRAEQALYDEKERAQVTLASIGDAVIRTGSDGRVEYMNPVAETLTGWTQAEAVGLALPEVFDIVDQHTGAQVANPVVSCLECGQVTQMAEDVVLIGRHGVRHAIENSAAPIRDRAKKILGVVLVFHDVTEQRRLSNQISYQATHDMLTGLVNRHEFELRVDRAIASAQANSSQHVLCYMDLDQFKVVNDTCGHVAGDQLLRQLASVLGGRVRARDTLARLGGDEFGLLLEHCLLEQGQRVANALREAVDEFRFVWAGRSFRIGVSIGLVSIDRNIGDQAAVLQAADSACYVAKDAGRNRVHTYDQHDAELARRHGEMQWIARIQQALDEELFRLHAQAIVPLCAPVTAGIYCELLVRMAENAGTLVMPGSFMPAAERYHLAAHIDRWVVDQAFRWLDDNPRRLARLALCTINLSAQSLSDEQFLNNILSQFDRLQLPSSKICFEITETAAIGNLSDAIHFITRLKARGCRFALDDFGSGLSSFAYLKSLAVDFLKIDGVFVKDVVDDPVDFAMVRSINEIGQLLGKQTIAEHVENPAIIERLRDVGVDYVQGYGVGMPQPLEYLLGEEN